MSKWYEPKLKDITIEEDELHAWIDSDDSGNIYVSFKIEDIKNLIKDK